MGEARLISALLAVSLARCGSEAETRFVGLPEASEDLQFVLLFREQQLTRTWNPVDLASAPVRFEPEPDDLVVHISMSKQELAALDPSLPAESLDQLVLARTPPCRDCSRACVSGGGTLVSLFLPEGARYLELSEESFIPAAPEIQERISSTFRLELERSTDECPWRTERALLPFGSSDEDLLEDVESLLPIDHDRVLIFAPPARTLMLAMRGRDRADNMRRVITSAELPGNSFASYDVRTVTSSTVRLIALTRKDSPSRESYVSELEVSESGFRVVKTVATIPDLYAELATLGDDGFAVVGGEGRVATSTDGINVQRYSLGASFQLSAIALLDEAVGTHFVGGGLGFVAEGDLLKGAAGMHLGGLTRSGVFVDSSVTTFRIQPTPKGPVVWAGTNGQGVFVRTARDEWKGLDFDAPLGVEECVNSVDECGRSVLDRDLEGYQFDQEGTLILAITGCSTFFTQRWGSACTGYFDIDGAPANRAPGIIAIAEFEDRVFLMKGARLYEIEP